MQTGVSLEIEKGSFVAILGHNGSGKSTMAKHLNAILLPTGGTVYVQGMDTKEDENLLDIALLEIAEGLLSYEFPDENEVAAPAENAETAATDAE